jgi:hypothetical protein
MLVFRVYAKVSTVSGFKDVVKTVVANDKEQAKQQFETQLKQESVSKYSIYNVVRV